MLSSDSWRTISLSGNVSESMLAYADYEDGSETIDKKHSAQAILALCRELSHSQRMLGLCRSHDDVTRFSCRLVRNAALMRCSTGSTAT